MIGLDQSPAIGNETQFKKGSSGNPAGKPKGSKHLSTHIRNLLEDEGLYIETLGVQASTVLPVEAIIRVMITKAVEGDVRAGEWLAKYGYGKAPDDPIYTEPPPELVVRFIGGDPISTE